MGKRVRERQPEMWVATTNFPTAASHPFYTRLNQRLAEHYFDDFVEGQCQPFYAEIMGRPGLPPGMYFRLLLIGYFEGIDSIYRRNATPSMRIDVASAATAGNASCGNAANCWSNHVRISTRPEDSGACTCAATKTCSSGCSCMRAPSIWGSGCGRLFGIGTPRGLQSRLAALGGVLSTLWSLVCKTITPIGSQTDRPTPSVPTDEQVNCVSLKTPLAPPVSYTHLTLPTICSV